MASVPVAEVDVGDQGGEAGQAETKEEQIVHGAAPAAGAGVVDAGH
ncbi:MAG: hypothetical protein Q8Q73_10935 [Stagnimonas sp.]|nr:hypothetical protein [Stagnimonas sp.]